MTLDTRIKLDQYVDIHELRDWINLNLLDAPNAIPGTTDATNADNQLGQGLAAWLMIEGKEGALMAHERDEEWDDDESWERTQLTPEGYVTISFDTAYGYKDNGEGCTQLHVRYLTLLNNEFLAPRGIGMWWRNEYRGEWYKGLDEEGLRQFVMDGTGASDWYYDVVLPAIPAMIAEGH